MLRTGALIALVAAAFSGCASSASDPVGEAPDPTVVDIAISGDTVTPNGDRIRVRLGQPVDLVVKADEPGEIHVHSRPESQEFIFEPGTTTFMLEIDSPGVVEIESHNLGKTIVQLEVR